MATSEEIMQQLMGVGISEHDALVLADCIITRKSCSWVNLDPVNEKLLSDLESLIKKQNYRIKVTVEPVRTRDKFIWDVKVE